MIFIIYNYYLISDKYSVFLKGYGLYNLGHDQNNKITQA